ncbi:hypothetical protein [Streptomyces sp. 135]|uniref:hypothetical protein n=1 Tax=Streptomyces sp. 135 TaxID=2838850 RepID=UPI001CBD5BC8|nr:hypothetical protein [Streptomyces sp. 135]
MNSLDDQLMTMAESLHAAGHADAADELRNRAAFVRETWRGADTYPHLADALQVIADNAARAATLVAENTVPPMH